MQITQIELRNFRNHRHLVIEKPGKVLIIVGSNAEGKTNIIEALQILTTHESFRRPKSEELLNKDIPGLEEAQIGFSLDLHDANHRKQIVFRNGGRKYFYDKKERSGKELIDYVPSVLFTPDDLHIIKGLPEQRRELLDDLGVRLSKSFAQIRNEYYKALKQKNSLLKQEEVEENLLDSWNINLAKLGTSLGKHRAGLFEKMIGMAAEAYAAISGGEVLTGNYHESWRQPPEECSLRKGYVEEGEFQTPTEGNLPNDINLCEDTKVTLPNSFKENDSQEEQKGGDDLYTTLLRRRDEELHAGRSLVGPHKDDVVFMINGLNARRYASQGQQRSLVLSLKIAEIEILRQVRGINPLLLLDDVMSELDERRRGFFLELIEQSSQTILTTTNLGYFEEDFLQRATVFSLGEKG